MNKYEDNEIKKLLKEECKLNTPELWNKIDKKLQSTEKPLNLKQNHSMIYLKYKWISVAACILLVLGVGYIVKSNLYSSNVAMDKAENSISSKDEEAKQDAVFDLSPVEYSSLNFGDAKPVSDALNGTLEAGPSTLCIAAFSESFIGDANIVFKGTIVNAYTKRYDYETYSDKFEPNGRLYNHTITIIHEVRVDEIYYNEENIKTGDVIKVEDIYYNGCVFTPDTENELKINGQYILSLYNAGDKVINSLDLENYAEGNITRDGNYSIIYPFAPQIEVTQDNQYIFHNEWESLLNDKTVDVIMNYSSDSDMSYYNDKMKLRSDDEFIDDLKTLIEKYK